MAGENKSFWPLQKLLSQVLCGWGRSLQSNHQKVKKAHWLLGVGLLLACTLAQGAPLQIVVSLKPIHSLVAGLTEGITTPDLLLPDGASPHTFSLKPSHLKKLKQADLIIWVGPELELFMQKAMQQMQPTLGTIALLQIPGLSLLPQRHGRMWQDLHDHHHDEEDKDKDHDHDHASHEENIDPHFWLATDNAQVVVNYLSTYLTRVDPVHAKQYQANAKKLQKSLQQLKMTLRQQLQHVQQQPFLVYHDGYQYFEQEFHLQAIGTLVLNPHLPLSAQGLHAMQKLIEAKKIRCVFRETEFNDTMILNALNKLPVTVAELDPLGVRQAPGPDNYEKTMLALGTTFKDCLAKQ